MAKFLIVEARFYEHLNDMLLDGARDALKAAGHSHETITVPGAAQKRKRPGSPGSTGSALAKSFCSWRGSGSWLR